MRFSITRLLIIVAIVAVWLGMGRAYLSYGPQPPRVPHEMETFNTVMCYIAGPMFMIAAGMAIAFVCMLFGMACYGLWNLAGLIESTIKGEPPDA